MQGTDFCYASARAQVCRRAVEQVGARHPAAPSLTSISAREVDTTEQTGLPDSEVKHLVWHKSILPFHPHAFYVLPPLSG